MLFNLTKNQQANVAAILLYGIVAAIVVGIFPSDSKFKYQFEIGKPWTYELMTAPYDFPIYKSASQVATEKETILKDYKPFYKVDTAAVNQQLEKFYKDRQNSNGISPYHFELIKQKFKKIYSVGLITSEERKLQKEDKRTHISCIYPNRLTKTMSIDSVYTPKTAYEEIINDVPQAVKGFNLNMYLVDNLRYDTTTSELAKKELLKGLSLTSGMIQANERIVDKGEIVNPTTYSIMRSLKIEFEKRNSYTEQSLLVQLGTTILVLTLIGLYFLYLYLFRPRIFENFWHLVFLSIVSVMMIAIASFTVHYSFDYYMVPYALIPIIVRVFFDPRTALFAHIITVSIISFMVDNSYQFLVIQIAGGMIAVSSLKDMTQRSQLAQTAFFIFAIYTVIYLGFEFESEGDWHRIDWIPVKSLGISSIFILFAYVLIFIFEKIFGLVSSITLLELNNINSDLMLRFAEVAPGTFQHSLQVSNLATEAAKKINANSLLVRTGALYHDIGKMEHPEYFIENQKGGHNPLLEMDFAEASQKVIQHVPDGVKIAQKYHLPEQIINFITTHHGISKTKYFYNSFINANPGVTPDEALFTYPGPRPRTKEAAIVMMADAVEARSRSLSVYSEATINEVVENMIDTQIADGEFKKANITFRDVEIVKMVFKEKLKNVYHNRIVYPKLTGN